MLFILLLIHIMKYVASTRPSRTSSPWTWRAGSSLRTYTYTTYMYTYIYIYIYTHIHIQIWCYDTLIITSYVGTYYVYGYMLCRSVIHIRICIQHIILRTAAAASAHSASFEAPTASTFNIYAFDMLHYTTYITHIHIYIYIYNVIYVIYVYMYIHIIYIYIYT